MAAGSARANGRGGNLARRGAAAATGSIFPVLALAVAIALVSVIQSGQVREGVFLALLVFILLGALVPPVAIALGVVILVAMFMRGAGVKLFSWLGSLASAQPVTRTATAPPLGAQSGAYSADAGWMPAGVGVGSKVNGSQAWPPKGVVK